MTITEIMDSPAGTMFFYAEKCRDAPAGRRDMDYRAVHYERIHGAVKPVTFYAETYQAAYEKAERYDKKRKELRESWKKSASARRRGETSGT